MDEAAETHLAEMRELAERILSMENTLAHYETGKKPVTVWDLGRDLAELVRHYDPPEDVAGTVFDPSSETFGPIMAALQSGDFEKAARLTADLATPPATRYTEDEKAAFGVTDEDLKR